MSKQDFGKALQKIYEGLDLYVDAYREEYESEVGDDAVLGDHWADIASGLLGLLNGETGRVDPGNMDRDVRDLASAANLDPDDL